MNSKLIKVFLCLILLNSFSLFATYEEIYTLPAGSQIRLSLAHPALIQEKFEEISEVFYKTFLKAYESYTKEELKISYDSKEEWLREGFLKKEDLKIQSPSINYLIAWNNKEIIGFISFEPEKQIEKALYIGLMVILPEYWRQGIGKKMMEYIEKNNPVFSSLVLVTRIVNTRACHFYEKLGFIKGIYRHPPYSSDTYVGYKKELIPHLNS